LSTRKEGVVQGDQKVSVYLTITVQSSGVQRLFDHSLNHSVYSDTVLFITGRFSNVGEGILNSGRAQTRSWTKKTEFSVFTLLYSVADHK